jgi:hypothetical protein
VQVNAGLRSSLSCQFHGDSSGQVLPQTKLEFDVCTTCSATLRQRCDCCRHRRPELQSTWTCQSACGLLTPAVELNNLALLPLPQNASLVSRR